MRSSSSGSRSFDSSSAFGNLGPCSGRAILRWYAFVSDWRDSTSSHDICGSSASAAEREAAFIEQVATPSLRSAHADRKEYGVETVEELGSLFSQLMHLLLRKELQRII